MTRQDFLLNDDGDFPYQDTYKNGVIQETPYGDSDMQHIDDIITSFPGHFKEHPIIGFGISQYLNAETSVDQLTRNLNINLEKDGYKSSNGVVETKGDGFIIDSDFISSTYQN